SSSSSASITRTHGCCAFATEKLRALLKSSAHSNLYVLAPNSRATVNVSSVEPVSTTTTSSTIPAKLARHRAKLSCSFLTIIHALSIGLRLLLFIARHLRFSLHQIYISKALGSS